MPNKDLPTVVGTIQPSVVKPRAEPRRTMPGRNGGTLVVGGLHSIGGRPRNEFLEWCQSLLKDPKTRKQVQAILHNRKHPAFAVMWKTVSERVEGKPIQPVVGDLNIRSLSVVVRREEKAG